jgi:hypothetical protein
MNLARAVAALQTFGGTDLTRTLASIEVTLRGMTAENCASTIAACGADKEALAAAGSVKRLAGQINVVIHALGIMLCLPHLLEAGEAVEYLSLGAGNTGRAFDLETTYRVAEFKFIAWQGGPESIRQNALFKDFYLMAESKNAKRKYLYVLGTEQPLKFLNGGRALSSVLSRHVRLRDQFESKYGDRYRIVRDYYQAHKEAVAIQDVSMWVPQLVATDLDSEDIPV